MSVELFAGFLKKPSCGCEAGKACHGGDRSCFHVICVCLERNEHTFWEIVVAFLKIAVLIIEEFKVVGLLRI
jgi:hypothetical protein